MITYIISNASTYTNYASLYYNAYNNSDNESGSRICIKYQYKIIGTNESGFTLLLRTKRYYRDPTEPSTQQIIIIKLGNELKDFNYCSYTQINDFSKTFDGISRNIFEYYEPIGDNYSEFIDENKQTWNVCFKSINENGFRNIFPILIYNIDENGLKKIYCVSSISYSGAFHYCTPKLGTNHLYGDLYCNGRKIVDTGTYNEEDIKSDTIFSLSNNPNFSNLISFSSLDINRDVKYAFFKDLYETKKVFYYDESTEKYETNTLAIAFNKLKSTWNLKNYFKKQDDNSDFNNNTTISNVEIIYNKDTLELTNIIIRSDQDIKYILKDDSTVWNFMMCYEYHEFNITATNEIQPIGIKKITRVGFGFYPIQIVNGQARTDCDKIIISPYIYITETTKNNVNIVIQNEDDTFETNNNATFYYNKHINKLTYDPEV